MDDPKRALEQTLRQWTGLAEQFARASRYASEAFQRFGATYSAVVELDALDECERLDAAETPGEFQ